MTIRRERRIWIVALLHDIGLPASPLMCSPAKESAACQWTSYASETCRQLERTLKNTTERLSQRFTSTSDRARRLKNAITDRLLSNVCSTNDPNPCDHRAMADDQTLTFSFTRVHRSINRILNMHRQSR